MEARRKGQVAKSRDLTSVCVLVTGGVAIYLSSNLIFSNFRGIVENTWSKESFTNPAIFASPGFFAHILLCILLMIAPVVLSIVGASVILNLVQMKGLILSFDAMKLSFSHLNPLSGIKRLFSTISLIELVKSIFKSTIVFTAVYSILWPERNAFSELWRDVPGFLNFTGMLALKAPVSVRALHAGGECPGFLLPEGGRPKKTS